MTFCHVVIGEVVPKNLAIDKADRLAVIVAPVLMLFYRFTSIFATAMEGSSKAITRALGGKGTHRGGGHSAEELKHVVSSSRFAGNLPKSQETMILRVLDLEDLSVREIMTAAPRHYLDPLHRDHRRSASRHGRIRSFAPAGLGKIARAPDRRRLL